MCIRASERFPAFTRLIFAISNLQGALRSASPVTPPAVLEMRVKCRGDRHPRRFASSGAWEGASAFWSVLCRFGTQLYAQFSLVVTIFARLLPLERDQSSGAFSR